MPYMYTVRHKTYRKAILSETLLHSFTCHCYRFLPAVLAICLILLQSRYSRSEGRKYKSISPTNTSISIKTKSSRLYIMHLDFTVQIVHKRYARSYVTKNTNSYCRCWKTTRSIFSLFSPLKNDYFYRYNELLHSLTSHQHQVCIWWLKATKSLELL